MAVTQFRLFKICTCLASILSFFKRLICRSGRGRKLSGDQITLPTAVDYSSVPKQVEEWSSWDDEAPTSVKIEGGNGTLASGDPGEPDYFKDMTPTIRKTQKRSEGTGGSQRFLENSDTWELLTLPGALNSRYARHTQLEVSPEFFQEAPGATSALRTSGHILYASSVSWINTRLLNIIVIKKREPANYIIPDVSLGYSSRLAATQDISFIHQSAELGDLETWQENTNAWEEEDATWQAEEVLRQQKLAEREKRSAEQQRKKIEKEVQRHLKKDQSKIGVKLS